MSTEIKNIIENTLRKMGVTYDSVEVYECMDRNVFKIQTKESNILLGQRGEVLKALNHIIKKTLQKKDFDTRFMIDINDYKTKQIEEIKNTAKLLAQRAKSLKYDVEMRPMNSYERMIVHSTLSEEENIITESIGSGRGRRVVIKYAN